MANKKRAAVPKPAVKAKPTEDQLEKARIEKEKQDKLAKMKELYEKGSSLIDIGKLHRIRPHQVRGYLLKGNVKMRTTAETRALKKKQTGSKKQ